MYKNKMQYTLENDTESRLLFTELAEQPNPH